MTRCNFLSVLRKIILANANTPHRMSAMGQKRTGAPTSPEVRFVPMTDMSESFELEKCIGPS